MKFNNLNEKLRYIQKWHAQMVAIAKKKEMETGKSYMDVMPSLKKAIKACKRKHDKYYGNTSKYPPHQGYQEQERRRS